jgi:hypothetical protein
MKKAPFPGNHADISADYNLSARQLDRHTSNYLPKEEGFDIYFTLAWSRYARPSWIIKFTKQPQLERPLDAVKNLMDGKTPAANKEWWSKPGFAVDGNLMLVGYLIDDIVFAHPMDQPAHPRVAADDAKHVNSLAKIFYEAAERQARKISPTTVNDLSYHW